MSGRRGHFHRRSRSRSPGRHEQSQRQRSRSPQRQSLLSPSHREGDRTVAKPVLPLTGERIPEQAFPINGLRNIAIKRTVYTNHFALQSLPKPANKILQYDIRFRVPAESQLRGSDKVSEVQIARVMLNKKMKDLIGAEYVFNGVNRFWTTKALFEAGSVRTTVINLGARRNGIPNEIEIQMQISGHLNVEKVVEHFSKIRSDASYSNRHLNPMANPELANMLSWLDALFRTYPASFMMSKKNGNMFFDRSESSFMALRSTRGLLEALRGFHQSVSLRFERLTINLDVATIPSWSPQCMINAVCGLIGCRPEHLERQFINDHRKFHNATLKIIGVIFQVKHLAEAGNEKKRKFLQWAGNAVVTTFDETAQDGTATGNNVSVLDYFRRRYGIALKYPDLPLIHSRSGDFPLELAFIVPSRYSGVLDGPESADFIKLATAPPVNRMKDIQSKIRLLGWQNQSMLTSQGVTVNPNMMRVPAAVLPTPQLFYDERTPAQIRGGRWNLRGIRLRRPMMIKSWGLLYFGRRRKEEVQDFMVNFRESLFSVKLEASAVPFIAQGNPDGDVRDMLLHAIEKTHLHFNERPAIMLILIDSASVPLYNSIKHLCDTGNIGIATQFMVAEKAMKPRAQQYACNVALKINVKLGGLNSQVEEPLFQKHRYMLVGGDTSHPSAAQLAQANPPPTTAALTATYDAKCARYSAVVSLQQTALELMDGTNFRAMYRELLRRYMFCNGGQVPQRIVYFRDGVGESQFDALLRDEGRLVYEVSAELARAQGAVDAAALPRVTVVVAIKRHHTRFFPAAPAEGDRLGNVACGTVVANSSTVNDVFLTAHAALQGTARPTRYVSLKDQCGLAPEDFQRLIHGQSYAYARATTAVAVVPCIRYADQVCTAARRLTERADDGTLIMRGPAECHKFRMWWH